jgi:hypothetical protein
MGFVVHVAQVSERSCQLHWSLCRVSQRELNTLCDVSGLRHSHVAVDESRELPETAYFFSECWWRETAFTRRELHGVVQAELVELPCCADAARGL